MQQYIEIHEQGGYTEYTSHEMRESIRFATVTIRGQGTLSAPCQLTALSSEL